MTQSTYINGAKTFLALCSTIAIVACSHTSPIDCSENLEPWFQKDPSAPPIDEAEGDQAMRFRIFEAEVSGTSFTMGALVQNRSPYLYLIKKDDAELRFTKYAEGRMWEDVPFSKRNHIASVSIFITSWEDGESPALRLASCQEKWIRFRGKLDATNGAQLIDGKVEQASILLFRLVDPGWAANPSLTGTLDGPHFVDPLIQNCRDTLGCGK